MVVTAKTVRPRSEKVRRSVENALARWRPGVHQEPEEAAPALPAVVARPGTGLPPPGRRARPRSSVLQTLLRLIVWLWAFIRYEAGTLGDALRRRNTVGRRATRLRRIFEGLGPTFVKVGQQLSVRSDLLPFEFCRELSFMLDEAPPFSTDRAIEIIEDSCGVRAGELFSEFQREPIGSASLSCVYKARLHSGEWVAIKVRRPNIVPRLAADIRALGWILQLAEWLSVFKPGFTRSLRKELAGMLFEEIDFLREARNAEIFRAEAQRHKQGHLSAPRVYFDLCSDDVLVAEFVTGTFLNEILRALDRGDVGALEEIRARGIDLAQVARNLVMTAHWELLESILFHADPHPANICVQPGNVLVFLDFGSCGRLTGRYRRIWQRFYQALSEHNIQDMVSSALAILEPLPHLDVESFSREIELMFWDWVYAMNSEHSAWWEKASGLLWMRFAGIARRYQAYMSAEIVRIFRATFLYDTTIFRLSESLDMRAEYRRYQREAGKRARRKVRRAVWRRIENGWKSGDYVAIANLWQMGWQIVGRLQHYLDTPQPSFARVIGKLAYGFTMLLRIAATGLIGYLAAVAGAGLYEWTTDSTVDVPGALGRLTEGGGYQILVGGVLLILVRKTILKLEEHDAV